MTDLGVIEIPDTEGESVEPVTFTLVYHQDGEKKTEQFTAKGTLPYGYLVEFWSTPDEAGAATQAAMTFFRRAMDDAEWTRFFDLVTDPRISAPKPVFMDILKRLVLHYETVDPTRARSGGPAKSPSGQRSTGRGSGRSRSAKARTSR